MLYRILKWLSVYEDEVKLFLWSALLLFLIRGADVIFSNAVETAFLKRYGVQYLPIIYMINAVVTFFIMGMLTVVMRRVPDSRLLMFMLIGSGILVAGLRFLIPFGIVLLYPTLFLLKSQLEVLLALVFWNMANDLFNTRQSKRLFPLITAGGVLGAIAGSFATTPLAKLINMDNLLLAYLGVCCAGALAVHRLGANYPTLLIRESAPKHKTKQRVSMSREIKEIWPLMKESLLIKVLIFLTLMPNIVIPIINYQFNYAVNQNYATEGGMLSFFSVFRGFLNIISLIILLFVGKLYDKWGLPVALMIHPFNYILAFLAFLFRFDIYSAIYARISTNVLRTTINNPARAVLMGLFPASQRAIVRPFLRGTVVRIGTLMGSGVILVTEHIFHPRYLSVVAVACVGLWIYYDFVLKRHYVKIITNFISEGMSTFKTVKEAEVFQIFRDKRAQALLLELFHASKGSECLRYGKLLQSQNLSDLDNILLQAIGRKDEKTRLHLLDLLSPDAGGVAIPVFREMMESASPELQMAMAKTANRFTDAVALDFSQELFNTSTNQEVKAHGAAGLYAAHRSEILEFIQSMLASHEQSERRAGVIAAGETRESAFKDVLQDMLEKETDPGILSSVIRSLHLLDAPSLNGVLFSFLSHPSAEIRLNALEAFEIRDDESLRKVVSLMGDPVGEVFKMAQEKVKQASYQNPVILVKSLNIPNRKLREHLFEVLETLQIKAPDVYRFARTQLKKAYLCHLEVEALSTLSVSPERGLMAEHLTQEVRGRIETVLRVLSVQDTSGRIRIIWRSIFSTDSRQRANGIEALTDAIDPNLGKILVPLLEDLPPAEKIKAGKKHFAFPDLKDRSAIISHLLQKPDWVSVLLSLSLLEKEGVNDMDLRPVKVLEASENQFVREKAAAFLHSQTHDTKTGTIASAEPLELAAQVFRLRAIGIFQGLTVSELAAIATVIQIVSYGAKEVVFREGDPGDTLYLIMEGQVSVVRENKDRSNLEIGSLSPGDYFGEMALLDGALRSATILTTWASRFMVLNRSDFVSIVEEYPQIALNICKTLCRRIRSTQELIGLKQDPLTTATRSQKPHRINA